MRKLALVVGLFAVCFAQADTTYIFNRTAASGAWNNPALWRLEDGSTPANFPDSTDAIVVFREENAIGLASLYPNNNHQYVSLKELRLEGCGGKWGSSDLDTDNLVSRTLTYQGVLKFAAGGGLSFPDLPPVSPQPLYYYLSTVPGCQGDGEVVFDIPGNVEVNFDRSDIYHPAADAGHHPVLVKRGAGLLSIANGGNRWNTSIAGAGRPEVPIKIEAGTARFVFATNSCDIAVPITFAGDTAKIIIDKRDGTTGGLGFGTGYIAETEAVTGGKHSIDSQAGSVIKFYGDPAVATQTFSGCLTGNVNFDFRPTTAKEFIFRKGVSTTTGQMVVKTGIVRITEGATFPNLWRVTINGTGETIRGRLVINEDGAAVFPKAQFLMYYGQIEVPAGRRVAIRQLYSWDHLVDPGIYKRVGSTVSEGTEAAWVAGDGLVVVGNLPDAAEEAVTWTGAANDGGIASTASNWSTPPQSLTDGSAYITTTVGNYAHFLANSTDWVKGFEFSQAHFAIGADSGKELRIGSRGLDNPANGVVVVGFSSAPGDIVLTANQTWYARSGHIEINGNVKTLGGAKLTVEGTGTTELRLDLETPEWNNEVLATNMLVKFNTSNAFGSTKGNPVTIFHYGVANSSTFADGVVVNRPLVIGSNKEDGAGTQRQTTLTIPENGTVTFNAPVVTTNRTQVAFVANAGSRAVFNDLFMSRNNVYVSGSGTLVFNGPFHTCFRFYPNGFTGTIELHSTGNRFNGLMGENWTAGTVKTMVPYAFTAVNPRRVTTSSDTTNNPVDANTRSMLNMSGTAMLDLCGNDQIFGDMNTRGGGIITSETPATLYMDFTANVLTEYGTETSYKPRADKATYTGAVNYGKWGNLPRWFMADSTSTGIVEVAEGKITFTRAPTSASDNVDLTDGAATAVNEPRVRGSWRNASAVVIKGGKMVFEHSDSVGRKTDVVFQKMNNAYGKLRLEAGVAQKVQFVYIDGVQQKSGTYGSSSSSADHKNDTLFEGTGVIDSIGMPGLFLLFR